jgi:hypothetical protein
VVLFIARQKGQAKPGMDEQSALKGADRLGEMPPDVGLTEKGMAGRKAIDKIY